MAMELSTDHAAGDKWRRSQWRNMAGRDVIARMSCQTELEDILKVGNMPDIKREEVEVLQSIMCLGSRDQ